MLTVHDFKGVSNLLRVRVLVAEKELDARVRYETVDGPNGAERTRDLLPRNRAGAAPARALEGRIVRGDRAVIADHRDHVAGEQRLDDGTRRERAGDRDDPAPGGGGPAVRRGGLTPPRRPLPWTEDREASERRLWPSPRASPTSQPYAASTPRSPRSPGWPALLGRWAHRKRPTRLRGARASRRA